MIKSDCVFFEHNFSADKIINYEHLGKMWFVYEGPTLSKITGQDLNPGSTSTRVIAPVTWVIAPVTWVIQF